MSNKIKSGLALVKVLESWGVKNIYGIPGGSINSLMDALWEEKDNINFVQVRHEEVGAMAASMHAKLTGHIGVSFGTAGPGGTHLFNGLYDAREDHVPSLAIIGQFATSGMNMDTFQEMNENPMYADVSVYNRTVMTPEQVPHVIDEAIRTAYAKNGVAVVQLPVDLPSIDIDEDSWYSSAQDFKKFPNPKLNESDVDKAIELLSNAEKPLIFAGIGTRGAEQELKEFAEKIKAPILTTGISVDIVSNDTPYWLGSANRVGTKPANEALSQADTVLFIGSNYPFSEVTNAFVNTKKFIQVDINQANLGKRHFADVTILGDAKDVLNDFNSKIIDQPESGWWNANLDNVSNWQEYLTMLENRQEGKLELYQVYKYIHDNSAEDAIFSVDVGDVTQTSVRHLHLNGKQPWRTSALFATMGIGIPGAITAKLDFPDKQVWNLTGDGAFNMVMQDLATMVQYKLPSINVVFSNDEYGFIKDEQEDTNRDFYGVEFMGTDKAMVAKSLGAIGYSVNRIEDLKEVFSKAMNDYNNGKVVLIDATISKERPFPSENMKLDSRKYSQEEINNFKKRYSAENLVPLNDYLDKYNVSNNQSEVSQGGF